jgi:hypothetical protein
MWTTGALSDADAPGRSARLRSTYDGMCRVFAEGACRLFPIQRAFPPFIEEADDQDK